MDHPNTSSRRKSDDRVELVDCGRASEQTKGVPFSVIYEFGIPPFDRQLIL